VQTTPPPAPSIAERPSSGHPPAVELGDLDDDVDVPPFMKR
jgi:hypothetical protein